MSFVPLKGGFSSSLLGAGTTPSLMEIAERRPREDVKTLEERIHAPSERKEKHHHRNTIIIVIISAIIFVTVVSMYDVVRVYFNAKYADKALNDPNAHNDPDQVSSTTIANYYSFISSVGFSLFCLASAVILISILYRFIR